MKKLFALILALLMLCSCEVQEEVIIEEPKVEIFESEDGKFGLCRGEEIICEAVFDKIESADDDEKLFYSYKAYVSGETELFLEEGGKHLYKVSERPVECFYLLDENGNKIFDIAFEKIGIDFVIDDNNNLLPNYLNGVSKGAYYSYDFSTGEPELVEEAKPEEIESDFGYTVTRYFYDTYGFVKYGVKLGEKVITENVADRIKIPLEDRILLYYGPTWQAFECGKCIIIDSEGNVLSEKFNRVEFATFENGTYVGIGITAGSRAEEPTFDENGERMPGGVWIIDKDGNILSENLFETDDFMGYYTVDEDSIDMISHDDYGNELKTEISYEGYILEEPKYPKTTKLTAEDEKVKEAVSYIEAIANNWFSSMLDNDPMVISWEIKSVEFDADRTNHHISYFFENGEIDEEALYEDVAAILIKTEINVKEEFHEGFGGFGEQKVWHEGNWQPLYTDCFYLSYSEAFYNEGYDEMYRKYAEDFETKWKIINYGPY